MRVPLYSVQELSTGKVSIMARPRGGDWLPDEIKDLHTSGVDILVSLLTDAEVSELDLAEEVACCQNLGIKYISFAIEDLSVPPFSEQTFELLRQLKAYLAEGKHIALHCRAGIGRSGMMAASLLAINGLTPERAFDLLSQVRGYSVPETAEQRAWVVAFWQSQRPG
ncbi:MAG TPA: dual specificity protein phosphatase family protein [Ktedonobacteraceae bacterium]|nr:dual specificity protein phosphatase family protein [Ktedonobacteraceae bacterium]